MEQQVKEQFNKAPAHIKEYVESDDFFEDMNEILDAHPLQNVQKEAYAKELLLTILQIENKDLFTANIKHKMEIAMKRAEEISKKTNEVVFSKLGASSSSKGTTAPATPNDGILPQTRREEAVRAPIEQNVDSSSQVSKPTATESVLQAPKTPEGEPLDIFKQRLQQPVHTPVEENKLSDTGRPVVNNNPSSKEAIESDPYKESF